MKEGRIARWALGAAGLVIAAAVGRWTAAPAAATGAPAPPVAAAPRTALAQPGLDRAAMRAEIRAAVAAALAEAPPAAGDRAPALAPEAIDEAIPSPEEQAAMDAASQAAARLLDDAVARSTWSAEDWRALEDLAPHMAPDERHDAYLRLAAAVNAQRFTRLAPPGSR